MIDLRNSIRFLREESTYCINRFIYILTNHSGERNKILVNGSQKTGTIWMVRLISTIPGYRFIGNFLEEIDRYKYLRPGDVVHGHDTLTPELQEILLSSSINVIMMVRDPRDQVVSRMYHIKRVKTTPYYQLASNLSIDDALMISIEGYPATEKNIKFPSIAEKIKITKSWINAENVITVRYEDLVRNPCVELSRVLSHLNIPHNEGFVNSVVDRNRFERLSIGRKFWRQPRQPGEMDPDSHFRKGIIGDWENHFKQQHKNRFKEIAGESLISMGYETDLNW